MKRKLNLARLDPKEIWRSDGWTDIGYLHRHYRQIYHALKRAEAHGLLNECICMKVGTHETDS